MISKLISKVFVVFFVFGIFLACPLNLHALTLAEYALLNQLYTTIFQAALNQAQSISPINGPGEYPFVNAVFATCDPNETVLASGTLTLTLTQEIDEDSMIPTNILEIRVNAKGASQLTGEKARIKVSDVFKVPENFFSGLADDDDFKINLKRRIIWPGKRPDVVISLLIKIDKDGHIVNTVENDCVVSG